VEGECEAEKHTNNVEQGEGEGMQISTRDGIPLLSPRPVRRDTRIINRLQQKVTEQPKKEDDESDRAKTSRRDTDSITWLQRTTEQLAKNDDQKDKVPTLISVLNWLHVSTEQTRKSDDERHKLTTGNTDSDDVQTPFKKEAEGLAEDMTGTMGLIWEYSDD